MSQEFGEARSISVLSAPSNLGLKPPAAGCEPGVRDLPEALLRRNLVTRLHAANAGSLRLLPTSRRATRLPASAMRLPFGTTRLHLLRSRSRRCRPFRSARFERRDCLKWRNKLWPILQDEDSGCMS